MQERRGRLDVRELCSGPGKLCHALGIDKALNESDLCGGSSLTISEGESMYRRRIIVTTRVGIHVATELPLRFYLYGSTFVSKKVRKTHD
jgi:DNA-3-methyladenine glycosylase